MNNFYLNVYREHPHCLIGIERLTQIAENRVKLLKIMDACSTKNFNNKSKKMKYIEKKLLKENLSNYHLLLNFDSDSDPDHIMTAFKEDQVSHFLLRIGFCNTRESRNWFLTTEWEWFKFRYQKICNKLQFLCDNNIVLEQISQTEKLALEDSLSTIDCGCRSKNLSNVVMFKTKFQEVLPLVRARKCLLKSGYAYFTEDLMINFVKTTFLKELNEILVNMSYLEINDDRIHDLIATLKVESIVNKYSGGRTDFVVVEEEYFVHKLLDEYSKMHYPLCMRFLHELLKENHHLRYFARMQYGLFIKELGVPYKEAMEFWEHEFTKKFSKNDFKSKFEYLFRHQYGKVGSMRDQKAYNCQMIISNNINALDQHGCPFAHWDADRFEEKLSTLGISARNIQQIMQLVNEKKYPEACAKYYEVTHEHKPFKSVNHPNEYFQESKEAAEIKTNMILPDIEDIFSEWS